MATNRILVFNVLTTISEADLREELMESYDGIKYIKRLHHMDEFETPKEIIQIEFESTEYAKPILQEGYIKIENLRCKVKGLSPSKRLDGSIYQSSRVTEEQQITNKILLCDVPVTIDVNVLRKQLSKIYPGIKQITRWCFDDRCQYPTVCVQIDFIASRYMEDILQDGFIVNGNDYYKVIVL